MCALTGHEHHGEEDDEQVGVVPEGEVGLHTHVLQDKKTHNT